MSGSAELSRQIDQSRSIVITALENSNLVLLNLVDEAMFLIDASGPTATEFVLQRLRFSDARIRFALYIPDQTNNAESHRPILLSTHHPRSSKAALSIWRHREMGTITAVGS